MTLEAIRQFDAASLLDTLVSGFTLKSTITTVLQDWMKGRRAEVQEINGTVVRAMRASRVNRRTSRASASAT